MLSHKCRFVNVINNSISVHCGFIWFLPINYMHICWYCSDVAEENISKALTSCKFKYSLLFVNIKNVSFFVPYIGFWLVGGFCCIRLSDWRSNPHSQHVVIKVNFTYQSLHLLLKVVSTNMQANYTVTQ